MNGAKRARGPHRGTTLSATKAAARDLMELKRSEHRAVARS